jgi:hypothetical protein
MTAEKFSRPCKIPFFSISSPSYCVDQQVLSKKARVGQIEVIAQAISTNCLFEEPRFPFKKKQISKTPGYHKPGGS